MSKLAYRPSSSYRWLNCPASVKAEAEFPDSTSSYAEEGTAAHELAEFCLTNECNTDSCLTEVFNGYEVTPEMAYAVQEYLDRVRSQPGHMMVEVSLNLSDVIDGAEEGGTSDCVVLDWDNNHAYVNDYKHGQGVRVDAVDNTQMLIYALGLILTYDYLGDIEKFTLMIHQPRLDHVSEWEVSKEDVLAMKDKILSAISLAESDEPEYVPGNEQCKFCKAKAHCRALQEHNYQVISNEFPTLPLDEEPQMADTNTLSNDEVALIMPHINTIIDWCKAIEARAIDELMQGNEVEGYKLVEGRSQRKWSDENLAIKTMKKIKMKVGEMYTKKLISVAQAEKHLGKAKFTELANLVHKPKGKPTLATESDKRPAINMADELGFGDITEDEAA